MNVESPLVKLQSGSIVRIHGQPFIVGQLNESGWSFVRKDGKAQVQYTFQALRSMLRKQQLTSDNAYRALSRNAQEALTLDWDSFTIVEQMSACRKRPFVEAVDKLPTRHRDRRKYLKGLICETNARAEDAFPILPAPRRVRDWYRRWVAAGRDIRALVDFHRRKGNRKPRLQDWEREELNAAIEDVYDTELRGSESATWRRARDRILLRARRENLRTSTGAKEELGKNAVGRALARRETYPLIANRFGRVNADRAIKNLGVGPQGDYPLGEVEVDHTLLDIIVVYKNGETPLGRPWLTALIDRYSRMIIGLAISFAPPSWVSVMEALRVAVLPKGDYLASLGGQFRFEWDCFGAPDCLFCDNGPEFRSASMKATEALLNMRIVDLEPGRPDLKGKIERWFRTLNQDCLHMQPGTTFSSPRERFRYDSKGEAVLTLQNVQWLVVKWIVDIYNQTPHSATGQTPAERWKRGMLECGEKPPPPKELIAPLTGLVVSRKLRREGIRYNKLRWNSNELQGLRNRIGVNADVLVRVDPVEIRHAHVLDEDTGDWLVGELIAETEVEKLTLSQYEHLRKKMDGESVFDGAHALAVAQAAQDIRDFVNTRKRTKPIVPKPIARFVSEGRKAAEHIHQQRWDPDESEKPLGSHGIDGDASPQALPPDARGPWREQIVKGNAGPNSAPTHTKSPEMTGLAASDTSESRAASVAFPGRRRKQ